MNPIRLTIPSQWLDSKPLFEPPACADAWQRFAMIHPRASMGSKELLWTGYLEKMGADELTQKLTQYLIDRLEKGNSSATDTLRSCGWVAAFCNALLEQTQSKGLKQLMKQKWSRSTDAWNLNPWDEQTWQRDAQLLHGSIAALVPSMRWGALVQTACQRAHEYMADRPWEQRFAPHEHLMQVSQKHKIVQEAQNSTAKCLILIATGLWAQQERQSAHLDLTPLDDFKCYVEQQHWKPLWLLNERAFEGITLRAGELLKEKVSYSNVHWELYDGALSPLIQMENEQDDYEWSTVVAPQALHALVQGTLMHQALTVSKVQEPSMGFSARRL